MLFLYLCWYLWSSVLSKFDYCRSRDSFQSILQKHFIIVISIFLYWRFHKNEFEDLLLRVPWQRLFKNLSAYQMACRTPVEVFHFSEDAGVKWNSTKSKFVLSIWHGLVSFYTIFVTQQLRKSYANFIKKWHHDDLFFPWYFLFI